MIKAFYNKNKIICGKCFYRMLRKTSSPNLLFTVTSIIDVDNDECCEVYGCRKLCSRMDALNCFKEIAEFFPPNGEKL